MRRLRVVLLLTTMLAALVMASGVAFAVNKVCPTGTTPLDPCKGTAKTKTSSGNDILIGTPGTDYIFALSGNDKISAGAGDDYTNGGAGNDIYSYRDGMGTDTVVDASGVDTLNFAAMVGGVRANLYPDDGFSPANTVRDMSFGLLVNVSNPDDVIEKVVGSASGDDFIQTGRATNVLQPGPGSGGATLIDIGGCNGSNQGFPPECGAPPFDVPVSNDTYSGLMASGYGEVFISDLGGTADKLILPFDSTDAYFEASDSDNSDNKGIPDSLLIMSTSTDSVFIFGQLVPYLGRAGHIETIQFTDGNFSIGRASAPGASSAASSSDIGTSQVDALNAASALGASKKDELAKAAKKILSKTQAPLTSHEDMKPPKKQ